MKTVSLLFLLLFSLYSSAQSEKELIAKANKLEASLNEVAALETFNNVLKVNPRNHYALWKASELYSRVGNRQSTVEKKQEFFRKGKEYAEQAIKVNPNAADGYYVLAVAMGRLALSQGGREKVESVKEIRTYTEKALKLKPTHGRAWHVMGKWFYEVSNMNGFEKAALKIIYGGLPPASLEQSIQAYEKARRFEPNFALNFLELAKAYKRAGQDAKATEMLKKLPAIPNKTQDDARIKSEGAALLKELNS